MALVALARSRPATRALYSASLLVVRKSRQTIHSIWSLSRERSTTPIPLACLLDDPSICIFHCGPSSAPLYSPLVNSAMKSTMTCPLMAVRGRYWMSNSLSSIAYSAKQPAASGLFIAHCIGLSVRTTTMWA